MAADGARALQQIGTVQACSRHLNPDLFLAALRNGALHSLQLSFDALQCLHAASIVVHTCAR
ncbi:hypothetical protein PSEUDO9AG_41335 [Pseudomonas sp. 9Ag]|nr:hypothetical protein PSEUDO9AG_41335 [Pseudomonas sp. 9Ag]